MYISMEVINIKTKTSNQFYFNFCILLILVYVFYGGSVRERMYYVGPGVFWEPNPDKTIQDGYFTGLTVGNRLFAILEKKQFEGFYNGSESVFFGPRIEFLYAQFKLSSPKGLPLWWHPGSSYNKKDEKRIIKNFIQNDFKTLIFLKNDRTRMPEDLLLWIERNYKINDEENIYLDIYKKINDD